MIARCEPAFDAPTALSSRSDFTDNFDAENRAPSGHGGRAEGTVKTDQIEHLNFDIDEPADDLVRGDPAQAEGVVLGPDRGLDADAPAVLIARDGAAAGPPDPEFAGAHESARS